MTAPAHHPEAERDHQMENWPEDWPAIAAETEFCHDMHMAALNAATECFAILGHPNASGEVVKTLGRDTLSVEITRQNGPKYRATWRANGIPVTRLEAEAFAARHLSFDLPPEGADA